MLNIWNHGREKMAENSTLRVALIGESYRRDFVREILDGHAEVVAELASDRRVGHLTAVDPEVVILDCGSQSVNPLVTLPRLAALVGSPYVVALTDISLASRLNERALLDLGADATIDIRDASAISRIAERAEIQREEDHAPVAA